MDIQHPELTARNFPSAEQEAHAVKPPSRYSGPESSFSLAFTDNEFLLREELRPVRMQLELLKPEIVHRPDGLIGDHGGLIVHEASGGRIQTTAQGDDGGEAHRSVIILGDRVEGFGGLAKMIDGEGTGVAEDRIGIGVLF